MNGDFHYYATYCAAKLAGYSHDECMEICYSANFVDLCTSAFLKRINGPIHAATTQMAMELADSDTDAVGLQHITRIWASFHFLPGNLNAEVKKGSKKYKNKYRLICGTNGDLLVETVNLAKDKSLQAVGVAMHVLADTWAHKNFAGTPSYVINNTNSYFYELFDDGELERKIKFRHSLKEPDDLEKSTYTNSISQAEESSIMNLGHGRAGHLPDYSFIKYKYLPAWADYEEIIKDNPSDFMHAFCQMIYAMKYLRGEHESFEKEQYDFEALGGYKDKIEAIIRKRRTDSSEDWKALGEELSGQSIAEFDVERYEEEYVNASEEKKSNTFLGRFILAAMAQKSMVTNKIYTSGNMLAGYSIDYKKAGFKGIKDFRKLMEQLGDKNGEN